MHIIMRDHFILLVLFGTILKTGFCLLICHNIPEQFKCDGIQQCFFAEDEVNCSTAVESNLRRDNLQRLQLAEKITSTTNEFPISKVTEEELSLLSKLITLKLGLVDYQTYLEAEKHLRDILYEAQMNSFNRRTAITMREARTTFPTEATVSYTTIATTETTTTEKEIMATEEETLNTEEESELISEDVLSSEEDDFAYFVFG